MKGFAACNESLGFWTIVFAKLTFERRLFQFWDIVSVTIIGGIL